MTKSHQQLLKVFPQERGACQPSQRDSQPEYQKGQGHGPPNGCQHKRLEKCFQILHVVEMTVDGMTDKPHEQTRPDETSLKMTMQQNHSHQTPIKAHLGNYQTTT